MNDG
jgi:hypothetical protein